VGEIPDYGVAVAPTTEQHEVSMSEPWLHERRTWTGHWWLPEKADQPQAGFLTYDPAAGLELTLVGGFEDRVIRQDGPNVSAVLEASRTWDVLHGLADNKEVTLLDCLATHSQSFGFGFGGPNKQIVQAQKALIGVHLETPDDAVFVDTNALIEDLWQWTAQGGLSASASVDAEGKRLTGESKIEISPVEKREVDVDGTTLGLHHWLTMPNYLNERRGALAYARDTAILSITPGRPASLRALEEMVQSMQDLISLAMHQGAAVLWCRLMLPPEERDRPKGYPALPRLVDLYQRHQVVGDPAGRSVNAHEVLFTLAELPFEEVVPRWFEVRRQFGATCNMLLGTHYSEGGYLETQLTTIAAAAEALHEQLPNKEPPIPPEEFASLKQALVDAVPDERKQWIQNVVTNRPSLRMRLDDLGGRLPTKCRERLLPNAEEWAKRTARARNDLSHAGKSNHSIDELYAIVQVTKAVVLLNLLSELGLEEEKMAEALDDNNRLRRACRSAERYL
jgi:hypothetical protein